VTGEIIIYNRNETCTQTTMQSSQIIIDSFKQYDMSGKK
jgi:hypothetical protein